MVSFFLYFLASYFSTIGISAYTDKKAEETLPISIVSSVMTLYLFGLFNRLELGLIVLLICSAVIDIVSVVHVIRSKKVMVYLQQLFSCPVLCIITCMLILTIGIHGKLFSEWDEFSHWGDVVKGMVDADALNSNPKTMSLFASYPPGMQLFQYLFQKINIFVGGEFSEWKAYFSYDLLLLSFIAPVLKKYEYKSIGKAITILLCTILTMSVFFNDAFSSLYIDVSLSCVFACGFFLALSANELDLFDCLNILSCCVILSILKDVGIILSIFILLTLVIRKVDKKVVISGVFLTIIPWIAWKVNVRINEAFEVFPLKYDFFELARVLLGRGEEYRMEVLHSYPQALITRTLSLGDLGGNISYLLLLILSGLVCDISICRMNDLYKRWCYRIIIPSFLVFYTIGLCITYMFQYTEYEAVNLMSLERYLNIPLCSVWMVIVYCWTKILFDKGNLVKVLFLLVLCIVICPRAAVDSFFSSSEQSKQIRSRYTEVENKIDKIEGINNIFVVSQGDKGFDLFVLHYLCRPNVVKMGEPYSVGPAFYEGDIWSQDLSFDELKNLLVSDYDYLVVMGVNDYFITNYSALFDGEIVVNGLYEIDKNNGVMRFVE